MIELAVLRACRQTLRLGRWSRLRGLEHVVLVHGLLVSLLAEAITAVVHGGDAGGRVCGWYREGIRMTRRRMRTRRRARRGLRRIESGQAEERSGRPMRFSQPGSCRGVRLAREGLTVSKRDPGVCSGDGFGFAGTDFGSWLASKGEMKEPQTGSQLAQHGFLQNSDSAARRPFVRLG